MAPADGAVTVSTDDLGSHRRLLFSIAYRMLGSVADAEDVVQETYLRWQTVDRGEVRSAKSYLMSIVTRLCIDHLRSERVREEAALPEPVASAYLPEGEAELADSLSIAFLVMLRKLAPLERAVFLLREVFEYDYAEVSAIVGRTKAHCRQLVRRSKERLAAGRERFRPSSDESRRLVERFQSVLAGGNVEELVELLAPDVTLVADGGTKRRPYGKARAIRRPVKGAEVVARLLVRVQAQAPEDVSTRIEEVNGEPAILAYRDGRLAAVLSFELDGGRIRSIFIQQDPDKQSGMGPLALLSLRG